MTSDLNRGDYQGFLADRADKFSRVIPSLPAMTVLGALENHEPYFIDATADNPDNIFPYNEHVYLIGMNDEELYDKISAIKPDVVLLTSMFTAEYFSVNRVAGKIKSRFDIPVVVGGHHASLRPNWHLDCGYVDFVALGEGEININDILDALN
jgi:magnesium-protoporphyrin IX monomethyl ester (oxidative) cyclase